jgi:hypothetical protein
MSKEDLAAKLARMATFTTPPADVVAKTLAAYAARVAELEAEVSDERERVGKEVQWQYAIREQERKAQAEQYARHQEEKRALVQQIGQAATTYNRVIQAKRDGRKTARIEDLLKEAS